MLDKLKKFIASLLATGLGERVAKTFLEAFVAQVIANYGQVTRAQVLISAGAAGLAAVYNGIISPWLANRKAARIAKEQQPPVSDSPPAAPPAVDPPADVPPAA